LFVVATFFFLSFPEDKNVIVRNEAIYQMIIRKKTHEKYVEINFTVHLKAMTSLLKDWKILVVENCYGEGVFHNSSDKTCMKRDGVKFTNPLFNFRDSHLPPKQLLSTTILSISKFL
jgi:hypothetical protein